VYILQGEDLRTLGATTYFEMLRIVPGFSMYQWNFNQLAIGLRGFADKNNNKLLVTVDGVAIMVIDVANVIYEFIPLAVDDIDRVEVIRGPAGTVYGANAVSGIINFYTKMPGKDTRNLQLSARAGSLGLQDYTLRGAYSFGKLAFNLSANYFSTDGYTQYQDSFRYNSAYNPRPFGNPFITNGRALDPSDAKRQKVLRGNVNYELQPGMDLSIGGWLSPENTLTADGGSFYNTQYTYNNHGGYAGWRHQVNSKLDYRLRYTAFYQEETNIAVVPHLNPAQSSFVSRIYRQNQHHDVEAQVGYKLRPNNLLLFGGNYRAFISNIPSVYGYLGDSVRNATWAGLYIQDEYRLLQDKLVLTLGLRADYNSLSDWFATPRLSIIYKLKQNHVLRLAGSLVNRVPGLQETYIGGLQGGGSSYVEGNRNLNSERAQTIELGYRTSFSKYFDLNVEAFYNQYQDIIVYYQFAYDTVNRPPYAVRPFPVAKNTYLNGGDLRSYGLEVSSNLKLASWLRGFVNLSVLQQNGEEKEGIKDSLITIQAPGRPPQQVYYTRVNARGAALNIATNPVFTGHLGLLANWKGFFGGLTISYADEITIKGSTYSNTVIGGPRLSANVGYEYLWRKRLPIRLEITGHNLTGDYTVGSTTGGQLPAVIATPSVFAKLTLGFDFNVRR
jgi:iron complex outermembrane receptor protein